jgi:hypothetical protein
MELDRKLEKQEKGPLYNLSTSSQVSSEENQGEGIGVGEAEAMSSYNNHANTKQK